MKKILLTGYGPFPENPINPTQEIAVSLSGHKTKDFIIYSEILPVVFDELDELIPNLLKKYSPEIVISLGLAADRKNITLEKVAKNIMFSTSPDNSGTIKDIQKILNEEVEELSSTLDLEKIYKEAKLANIDCDYSNDAGSYICNKTMFLFLNHIQKEELKIKSGFIHVPLSKDIPNLQKNILNIINTACS